MRDAAKSGYLPSLDGWRGLAILAVLFTHDYRVSNPVLSAIQELGKVGVFVFFSISGILMSWRIQVDEQRQGRFDIKKFYVRRLFRIQPALLLYLVVIALLMMISVLPDRWPFWWGALLSYRNFQFPGGAQSRALTDCWFTSQFWTLSVEEHFYILLSLFFYFVKRHRGRVLAFGIAVLLAARQAAIHFRYYEEAASLRRTYWMLPFLLIPALLAILLRRERFSSFARRQLKPWRAYVATCLLAYALNLRRTSMLAPSPIYLLQATYIFFCYGFSFWIAATMLHPTSWSTRMLELRPLRFVGRISYSLYLWQQLFFVSVRGTEGLHSKVLNMLGGRYVHYVVLFLIATASYYLVEKPLIRLGHWLAPPATPGHADLGTLLAEGGELSYQQV